MKDVFIYIFSLLKPYRKTVAGCTLLAFAAAGLTTIGPIVLGRGFDLAKERSSLVLVFAAVLGYQLIGHAAERLRAYLARRGQEIGQRVATMYRHEQSLLLLDKPMSFHYGKKISETFDKLSSLSWQTDSVIEGIVFDFVPAILTIVGVLGYLVFLDPGIAAVLTASIIGLVTYVYRTTPRSIALDREWNAASRDANALAFDATRNALIVKSTTNEQAIAVALKKLEEAYLGVVSRVAKFEQVRNDRQNLIIRTGSLLALLIAVHRLYAGTFSFGQVTAVTAYAFSIFGYVQYSQWQFRNLIRASTNYRDLRELMTEPSEDFAGGEDVGLRGGIEYRNVRFRYREDRPILEDVSFSVRPGERVAIVGESGEGKTTLVDLLGGYYRPQSGMILLDGRDQRDVNLRSLRGQMAYVPQDLTLFHDSLDANIRYGRPDAADAEVQEAARLAHLESFIEGLPERYATIVGERGLKLSGGERQRVALARAFLRNPKVLILDEPTSNLDSKTEAFIQDSLEKLMRGRTTFIIAHRLKTVASADKILVLKDGRIVEQGTHRELAAKVGGAYRSLLRSQQSGIVDAAAE
jgi:ABC-type multidrug transport system fused ATPase/permease subunit